MSKQIDDGEQEPPDEDYCVVCGDTFEDHHSPNLNHLFQPCRPGIDGEGLIEEWHAVKDYPGQTISRIDGMKRVGDLLADALEALLGERKVIIERNSYWRQRVIPLEARLEAHRESNVEAQKYEAKLLARIAELEERNRDFFDNNKWANARIAELEAERTGWLNEIDQLRLRIAELEAHVKPITFDFLAHD